MGLIPIRITQSDIRVDAPDLLRARGRHRRGARRRPARCRRRALADPLRVNVIDVLRRSEQAVCQCELVALFGVRQSLLSHHVKKLDMTDEMLALARDNAAAAGVANVRFVKGYIEDVPLPAESVDVVISNCVINLSADKRRVLAEVARVLRPGGRFAVSDVIADPGMDDATRADMQQWTGCIAGALTEDEFRAALEDAGLVDVEIRRTHRVHERAESAIVRARRPAVRPAA